MKHFHSVTIKTIVKPEDDRELLTQAFLSIFPFELQEQRLSLEKKQVEGLNNRKLLVLQIILNKDRHINEFVEALMNKLNEEQKDMLLHQKNRLDQRLHYFIRLDKDKLQSEDYVITDSGNCVHLEFSVAAFPKHEDAAWKVLTAAFRKTL